MSQKLEQLLCMRNQIDQIEIISWNDVSRLAALSANKFDQYRSSEKPTTLETSVVTSLQKANCIPWAVSTMSRLGNGY